MLTLTRRPLRLNADNFNPLGHETCEADLRGLQGLLSDLGVGGHMPLTVVEVGSYVGGTALAMLAVPNVVVHCVENFQGNPDDRVGQLVKLYGSGKTFLTFCDNCAEHLFRRIRLHVGDSRLYAHVWPFQVDMVFIDADHRYAQVREDIMAWQRHVQSGGILCGHDYGSFPGVTRAVDKLGKDGIAGASIWYKRMQ